MRVELHPSAVCETSSLFDNSIQSRARVSEEVVDSLKRCKLSTQTPWQSSFADLNPLFPLVYIGNRSRVEIQALLRLIETFLQEVDLKKSFKHPEWEFLVRIRKKPVHGMEYRPLAGLPPIQRWSFRGRAAATPAATSDRRRRRTDSRSLSADLSQRVSALETRACRGRRAGIAVCWRSEVFSIYEWASACLRN